MAEASIAFIGGSGVYDIDGLEGRREVSVDTPFGPPSAEIVVGRLNGASVAFLPRHGRGHRLSPTHIPVRANVYALKTLGVERVVSISAVGSLQEHVRPLDLVVPDQLIDRTKGRASTFFEDGIVAHVAFADPFCPKLSSLVTQAANAEEVRVHDGGTYVVMEGPQFSTKAESRLYQSWGASVIGMTALPEAKLAREAELCYATMAFVTDYDCWHESEESVSVELVVANLLRNVETSRAIVRRLAPSVPVSRRCSCADALNGAIISNTDGLPEETRRRLAAIVDRYLGVPGEV